MKILILAYYNPWISGGGHRPICLCEEDIARGDEVVFLFESDSEIDQMKKFSLFNSHRLRLLRRDKESGKLIAMHQQAEIFETEDDILEKWRPDYIKSHNPVESFLGILKKAKEKGIFHIYDQMDFWDGFPVQPWGKDVEKEYISMADQCITISEWLAQKNREITDKEFKVIPNAIKNAFADKLFMSYEEVKGRSKRKKKQIIYSGAIWPVWFEMDIIEYLVEKFPEYEFLMLGPYLPCKDEDDGRNIAEIIKNLEHNYNIKFLGQVPHEELVSYLRQANLAIVPFVVNEVTKACSPLKCFEYLGAFLPVVSTNLPEIKNYPMIEFACSKEEFANKVEKMIDHKITENEYKMMRNFTEENTWKARSQEINNIIIDKN